MPNSLKSRLKKLKHQGLLSEKDLSRIYTDKDVVAELEKIKEKIDIECDSVDSALDVILDRISELKGEFNEQI